MNDLTADAILKWREEAKKHAIEPRRIPGTGYGKTFYTVHRPMWSRLRVVAKRMRVKA